MHRIRRVALVAVIGGSLTAAFVAISTATFTDQVMSENNIFTAGTLFMSVDGECGPPDRTGGGGGAGGGAACSITTADLSVADLQPGDSASHVFTIVNEGSVAGELSVVATATGDCFDATVTGPTSTSLAANGEVGDETTATVEVALPLASGNECQGDTSTVEVTFDLVQAP